MAKGHQNCRGIKVPKYRGPVLQAVVAFQETIGSPPLRVVERRTTISAPLANPRKTDQVVLTEICARFKKTQPTARLVSFWREEV